MSSLSVFSIPPFLSALIVLMVSIHVFLKNPRSKTHQALQYFCLTLVVWTFCYSAVYSSDSSEAASRWARLAFYGIAFIPSTNFYFYAVMSGLKNSRWTVCFFALSVLFALIHFISPLICGGVEHFPWGYNVQAGPLLWLFLAYWATAWAFGIRLVFAKMNERKKAGDFISYNQAKYVFFGLVGQGLGAVDFLPSYGISIYPFGYIVAVYWCTLVAFAITQYKMLADITFLTRRVLIASAVIFQMAAFYLVIHLLRRVLPVDTSIYVAVISLAAGMLLVPMIRKTKNIVDKTFFPEFYERKEKLTNLGQKILLCKNPAEFNQIILDSIFNSFKITKSYLYIWNEERKSYALLSATAWGTLVEKQDMMEISPDHAVPKYLGTNPHLLYDEMRRDSSPNLDDRALSLAMLEFGVALCLPVCTEGRLAGIFLFGDKESGLSYSKDDIKALTQLASHTAVAIENIDLNKRWNLEVKHSSQMDKILHTYMGSSVADEVLRRVDQAQHSKRERSHATILMSDLRGFTKLSERFSPEEMVRALNSYFGEMTEIIMQNGGTVDKFMGDAILAVFGVPKALPESEKAAVRCALEMHECLKKLNRKRTAEGSFTMDMGIGIAAGDVVAGNIGSEKRMEFTVIGDAVNTASRLQSIASSGKILATNRILDKVADTVEYLRLPPIPIKGKSLPMDVIEILGFKKEAPPAISSDPSIIDLPFFSKKAQ